MNLGADPRDQVKNEMRQQTDALEKERKKKKEREEKVKAKIREKINLKEALKRFDPKEINKAAQGQKDGKKSAGNTAKAQ